VVNYSTCGNDTACNTVTVGSLEAQNVSAHRDVKIYPNPATNSFVIGGANGREFQICNVFGQVIYKKEMLSDNETINIAQLAEGICIALITGTDGVKEIHKLVKE